MSTVVPDLDLADYGNSWSLFNTGVTIYPDTSLYGCVERIKMPYIKECASPGFTKNKGLWHPDYDCVDIYEATITREEFRFE